MEYQQIAVLAYLTGMMIIDFFILWLLFRSHNASRKAVLFISSIFLYMSTEATDIGYILFYHGSILVEIFTIFISSIPILLSLKVKDKGYWRDDMISSTLLTVTLVLDEVSMGYAYSSAFGPHLNPIVSSVSNPAFGVMMMADAIFFLALNKVKFDVKELALFTFASSMAFMPNVFLAFDKNVWLVSSVFSSLIMIINIITLYLIEIRRASFNAQLLSISLAGLDFFMMLGLSLFVIGDGLMMISLAMIGAMAFYFMLIFHKFSDRKIRIGAGTSLLFVSLINLAELTMGFGESVLGFVVTNSIFSPRHMNSMSSMRSPHNNPLWWMFPLNPLSMINMAEKSANMLHDPLFSIFWASYMLIMTTTMMPFYILMMGGEMLFLVYERYKHAKSSEVRRWALMIIIAMPVFVWLLPYYTNFYIFGMSGMIFPVTVIGFILSMVIMSTASILFGRRAFCNTICMSAHMWTNAYYDKFKAKKNSNFWQYFRWIPFGLMMIFFSWWILGEVGVLRFLRLGMSTLNPLDLFGMFTLNYVWWFFFFMTPVFGTYSCARQGWCGYGTFMGIFNKVLFKVKPNDVKLCETCKEITCEKACPSKITIRDDILKKGFMNRISCIGCADCVEACEYNNLMIQDIRGYIADKKKLK
ncbi:4Fe-4S binding protein [Sulfuracidifex metallicus]|uniref:4Fe-4S ferredoxin n=1 Tax=Sulfuracidifex metallicus DSM 6482 = JCM 9184 TaxID=523847 RepID=A0A6A9QTR0_SULME|nr:4Fe-4S ferredoxin [Sulfuracidifex metallicus]MUN29173.1 4Fe-4S ferredoxin [Sulfuracidifex metallicus DSM 6482 = JCM 9184]WOE50306.1 4Fe-4S ferredoxin [Sulfuracidifex metallicus DSM 6482 = JCM 9184]